MTESQEDYLESIYHLTRSTGVARVKDISEAMQVKKPSVINALKELSKRELIIQERYGYIQLTKIGQETALQIVKKHEMLKSFLINILGVNEKIAEKDACRIEHILEDETINKINLYLQTHKN